MDAKASKDSGVANVLRCAMKAALVSGMKPSQLLAMGAPFNFNIVAGTDTVGVLKTTMKCALDRGTKPDVLINVAVEGNSLFSLKNRIFNFNIVAFKNQAQPSKEIVHTEQPVTGNAIEGTKPDKPAGSAVEGNTIFTPTITSFNFNIEVVANQKPPLKRVLSTEEPPRKKAKATATKEKQKDPLSDSDTSDQSDSSGMISPSGWGKCVTNSLQIRHPTRRSHYPHVPRWEVQGPSQSHKAKIRFKRQNE